MLIVVVCVGWFCVYPVICVLCLLWVVCVGCDVGSVWVCGYYICGWLWCGRVVYDVLGDSQGNTGLSRGVCGALCLGIRCWGFPGEYVFPWLLWYFSVKNEQDSLSWCPLHTLPSIIEPHGKVVSRAQIERLEGILPHPFLKDALIVDNVRDAHIRLWQCKDICLIAYGWSNYLGKH